MHDGAARGRSGPEQPLSADDGRSRGERWPLSVFFTSDTHFGDHRVLNLYARPFASVAAMDASLVAGWNAAVGPDDEVWHLGDVARGAKRAAAMVPQLHGRKHLITGNLDGDAELGHGWSSIAAYAEIALDGRRLVLCHYPFRRWNGMHRGWLNLHGHSHGRLTALPRQFDVGVDVRGWRPVGLAELLAVGAGRRRNAV